MTDLVANGAGALAPAPWWRRSSRSPFGADAGQAGLRFGRGVLWGG